MNSEHDRSKFSTPSDGLSPDLPQVDLPPVDLPTTAGLATPDRTSPQTGATEESPSTVAGLPPLAVGTDAASHLKKPATNELPPAADRSPAETVTNMFSQGDSHLDLRVGANAPADVGAAYENPSDAADLPVALPIPDAPAVPASPAPAGQTPSQSPSKPAALTLPEKIGRFDVVRLLGKGGFGEVYLGRDATLRRDVALKIPNWKQANSAESEHEFLEEARRLVDVKGPGIVIVYEVLPVTLAGQSRICIVQEFIDGQNLAEWHAAQPKPIDIDRIAQLVAKIATILSLIHRQRVVHRDLKPANIMIDKAGRPYVLDFGLALHDNQRREHAGTVAGTFPYMSPEQVRAKTHRMDARSDIWSLGVILYELFSGQRPFGGSNSSQLCEEIQKKDPWPIRQLIPDFPPSLDRICLKCLNRLRNDRYTTMAELAAELRSWRDTPAATPPKASHSDNPSGNAPPAAVSSSPLSSPSSSPSSSLSSVSSFSSAVPARVIPRGLRSFTEADSDFFLDLLPGVRERSGLPESLDFWKRRIESDAPEYCVPIGLLFGPSGCGKSSLIKAGLLPRLEPRIIKVYLEATQDTTERQLLGLIRQRLPAIPAELGLPEVLEGLRQHRWLRSREKLLIVIDQFEQWLYAHRSEYAGELSDALQQCDGRRVQAILMVRDEYTPASFDFMNSLDIELAERRNFRKVSLFDLKHARKVLKLFGQAYEQLPMDDDACTADQNAFLDAAVAALDEDGDYKVVSVQLAMFAQLMEHHEWTLDKLQLLGGVQGVGLAFLRESFDSDDASPLCKRHADAALKVLTSLLPPPGAEIKGHNRTAEELATAAGYSARTADFTALLKILDDELRLVTPAFDDSQKTVGYQLTHDYLVPSLTAWLEEKLRSSRRGRAQLRLQERTSAWTVKPENRHLPSLVEYARIATLTKRRDWTEPQQRMMRRAGFVHVLRATLATILLILLGTAAFTAREWQRIGGLTTTLLSANPDQILDIAQQLDRSPRFADAHLKPLVPSTDTAGGSPSNAAATDPQKLLHARLALLARYPEHDVALLEVLFTGKIPYAIPIRERLRLLPAARFQAVQDALKTVLRDELADTRRRFGAALALSAYVPSSDKSSWQSNDLAFVTRELVSANPEYQPELRRALRPLEARLRTDLERFFSDPKATDAQRLAAANAFADYASRETAKLAELLTVATPEQYAVLYPLVESGRTEGIIKELGRIAARLPSDELSSPDRIPFGQRRAGAAATLLRLGEREAVLPVFLMKDDPEALTQFIFRCRPRGVGVEALLDCLDIVGAAPTGRYAKEARYALLLALAEYQLSDVPENRRTAVLQQVRDWYATDPSSGVHGGANWLLRQWGESAYVKQIDETPMAPSADREWFTLAVKVKPDAPSSLLGSLLGSKSVKPTTFYYTFVVFPADDYTIGSPDDEQPKREAEEVLHRVRLTRSFAILNREVTFAELIAFNRERYEDSMRQMSQRPESSVAAVDWYDAVDFSRWLGTQYGLSESDQAYADPDSPSSGPRETNPVASWAPRNWPLDPSRRGFRLPSEAEWEIASRGGVRTSYGFGSDVELLDRYGWFTGNGGGRMHSPLELRPGHRGLFDMHGNAYEWVHDWDGDYGGSQAADPLGATGGSSRVYRGGGWFYDAADCLSANRSGNDPTIRGHDLGFRLALSFVGVPGESSPDNKK